uniref:Variant surface glycoprotein 1457 n=1 Tax=Trypanosoma brucei TaxID=5691 RepID=M4SYI6_9TRYP|nr:variant surface glycoprotein 1457 [Trypanosoma brucei]
MHCNSGLQLLVFLVSLIVTHSEAASTNPIKETTWKAACAVAVDLQKVQKRAAQMVKNKITGTANYLTQAYKTKIYIEVKRSGKYRKVDLALVEYYMRKANLALQEATGSTLTKGATAIANAAKFEGAIQEFVNMANQIAEDGTHACLIDGGDVRKRSGGSPKPMTEEGCAAKASAIEPSLATTTQFGPNGITNSHLAGTDDATTTQGGASCTLTETKASSHLINTNTGGNLGGDVVFAGGLFKLGTTFNNNHADAITTASAQHATMKAGHDAYLATKDVSADYAFKGAAKLAVDTDFKNAYRRQVLVDSKLERPDAPVEANAVESAFGSKMETEYKDFPDTKVIDLTGKAPEGKELSTINDLDELDKLLRHYQQARVTSLNKEVTDLKEHLKNPLF